MGHSNLHDIVGLNTCIGQKHNGAKLSLKN